MESSKIWQIINYANYCLYDTSTTIPKKYSYSFRKNNKKGGRETSKPTCLYSEDGPLDNFKNTYLKSNSFLLDKFDTIINQVKVIVGNSVIHNTKRSQVSYERPVFDFYRDHFLFLDLFFDDNCKPNYNNIKQRDSYIIKTVINKLTETYRAEYLEKEYILGSGNSNRAQKKAYIDTILTTINSEIKIMNSVIDDNAGSMNIPQNYPFKENIINCIIDKFPKRLLTNNEIYFLAKSFIFLHCPYNQFVIFPHKNNRNIYMPIKTDYFTIYRMIAVKNSEERLLIRKYLDPNFAFRVDANAIKLLRNMEADNSSNLDYNISRPFTFDKDTNDYFVDFSKLYSSIVDSIIKSDIDEAIEKVQLYTITGIDSPIYSTTHLLSKEEDSSNWVIDGSSKKHYDYSDYLDDDDEPVDEDVKYQIMIDKMNQAKLDRLSLETDKERRIRRWGKSYFDNSCKYYRNECFIDDEFTELFEYNEEEYLDMIKQFFVNLSSKTTQGFKNAIFTYITSLDLLLIMAIVDETPTDYSLIRRSPLIAFDETLKDSSNPYDIAKYEEIEKNERIAMAEYDKFYNSLSSKNKKYYCYPKPPIYFSVENFTESLKDIFKLVYALDKLK